jgi:hypothetical protein
LQPTTLQRISHLLASPDLCSLEPPGNLGT